MSDSLAIDLCDASAVGSALTQAYLFVSSVNAESAKRAFSTPRLQQLGAPLIHPVVEDVCRRRRTFSPASETVRLFDELGLTPEPKASIVGDVRYEVLEMHQGARIDGELKPLKSEERPALKLATPSHG